MSIASCTGSHPNSLVLYELGAIAQCLQSPSEKVLGSLGHLSLVSSSSDRVRPDRLLLSHPISHCHPPAVSTQQYHHPTHTHTKRSLSDVVQVNCSSAMTLSRAHGLWQTGKGQSPLSLTFQDKQKTRNWPRNIFKSKVESGIPVR